MGGGLSAYSMLELWLNFRAKKPDDDGVFLFVSNVVLFFCLGGRNLKRTVKCCGLFVM